MNDIFPLIQGNFRHKSYYLAVASWKTVAKAHFEKNRLPVWTAMCYTTTKKAHFKSR